jgi:hypothetical protein
VVDQGAGVGIDADHPPLVTLAVRTRIVPAAVPTSRGHSSSASLTRRPPPNSTPTRAQLERFFFLDDTDKVLVIADDEALGQVALGRGCEAKRV